MKRHILLLMWALVLPLLAQAQTDGYDPTNPPDPEWGEDAVTKYQLTLEAIPAANVWLSGSGQYPEGRVVNVSTSPYDDSFTFKCWKDWEGKVISEESSFAYTMPKGNTTIYAVYDYNPSTNPEDPVYIGQYTLTLVSEPLVAGTFSGQTVRKVDEGSTQNLYAYANSGFVFKCWTDQKGDTIYDGDSYAGYHINYLMPSHSVTLTAHFDYLPESPENPGTNLWDEENGELIIDFFNTGYLYSQINNMVPNTEDKAKVTSIIVEGVMNETDLNRLTDYLPNLTYVDLSRVTGLTSIRNSRFTRLTALEEVELPSCVTEIRYEAFNGCSKLAVIDCYALVPPTVGENAFAGTDADLTIFVPEQSIDLYKAADGWKDFPIESLGKKIVELGIKLPAGADDGRYKNLALELINVKSGQKFKYVLTDRVDYTFPNLVKRSKYFPVVKNGRGQYASEDRDTIMIGPGSFTDTDNTQRQIYTFKNVKVPQTLTAQVDAITIGEGQQVGHADVTDQVTFYWFDENKEYLAKGTELEGQLQDEKLYYYVELPEVLGRKFVEPDTTVYTILSSNNVINVELMEHPTAVWNRTWVANSPAGLPIWPVSYSFSQKLNGKYVTVSNLELNKQPEGTLPFTYYKGLPVEMTVSSEGYIPQSYTFMPEDFPTEVVLTPATGPIATIAFTWQEAAKAGTTAEVQSYYPDYQNVSYTIFNKTKDVAITQFTNQFPRLALPEGNEIGDEISITVSSTTGAFNDVTLTAKVAEDNTLNMTFPLVQRGGFTARFITTDNSSVMGLLFNAAGTLVKRQTYANFQPDALNGTDTNDFTVSELEDGNYTLITMGQSDFFSSIFELSRLDEAGLKAGTDYLKNDITIKGGELLNVNNVKVPLFEEEKFYYTGTNTSFTTNKSNVIQGNYLTFNTRVDFADQYKDGVSEVELVYPLPANADFVAGSLMLGKGVAMENQFQYVDNRTWTENVDANGATVRQASGEHTLTVQMSGNYSERVKFCIVPLMRGNYTPTAYVRFKYDGQTITQPIGSPAYTVNDVTIWTPSLISTADLHVDGNAPALSNVSVYDGYHLIGTTQALSDGYWSLETEIVNPVNLSMHQIRAEIETQEGYKLYSERRFVEYNEKSIQAKDVEMNFFHSGLNRTVIVKFDLEHSKANVKSYQYAPGNEFVFFANLTNNDPNVVDSCVVRVFTNNHEWVELPARYVEGKNWVAHGYFDNQHIPIGVRVNVVSTISDEIDLDQLETVYKFYPNQVNARSANKVPGQEGITFSLEPIKQGDDEIGMEGTYFQTTKDKMDFSLYQADTLAMPTRVPGDTIFVRLATDGSFVVVKSEQGVTVDKVWGVNINPAAAARGPRKTQNRIATEITEDLKARINVLSNLSSTITPFTNRTYLETLWLMAKQDTAYWWNNTPANEAQLAQQKYAKIMEKVYRYAVLNVGEITQVSRNINALLSYARYGIEDVDEWQVLADRFLPCDGNENYQAQALSMNWQGHHYKAVHGQQYITAVDMAARAAQILLGTLGKYSQTWYTTVMAVDDLEELYTTYQAISDYVMQYASTTYLQNKASSRNHMNWVKRQRAKFKCNYTDLAINETENKWDFSLPYPIVEPIIDPAGFVYEGVASNRLEGVTATAYYKNTYEDKWGDLHEDIVKWDAENYGQENPLYTDEKGMYQWDVPQGLWQVKFEKDGYLTAYSEWLPVPPPQMEVNVGMVQNAQPEVTKVRAFEKGVTTPAAVEIEFSKYMRPDTLNASTIFLKGKNADKSYTDALQNLTFTFPDLEESIEGSGVQYAKKVLVSLPEGEDLAQYAGGVNVTVSSLALSYANIPMRETFSQDFDPEKRIESIKADSLLQIGYEANEQLKIAALPTEAVAGKTIKVRVKSASKDIATLTAEAVEDIELTFDENGQTEVLVNGALFGTTAVQMQLVDDKDVTAQTMVQVLDPAKLLEVKEPVASRVSGSAVYRGETVTLNCETEGATIYYTTDGTCPCESATRKVYKNAIAINGDMTLKVMSVSVKGTESEVREYSYTIRQTSLTLDLAAEWNWASHNQFNALSIDKLKDVATRVQTQTQEAVYDSNYGWVGNLTEIGATTGVKVNAKAAATINLSGDEFNPKGENISLYTGWNWIGYPVSSTMTLTDALVYLNVEEGDRIVSLTGGSAEFANGEWKGELKTFTPAQSYLYKSQSDKSFIYNSVSTVNARALYGHELLPETPWTVNPHHYSSVMPVTADLMVNGMVADADEYFVGAFCGDECRGVGRYVDGQLYISVYGNKAGDEIQFVAVNALTGQAETLNTQDGPVFFQADVLGSVKAPFALFIGDATGINAVNADDENDQWYNLKGQRINRPAAKGLFIHGSQKVAVK